MLEKFGLPRVTQSSAAVIPGTPRPQGNPDTRAPAGTQQPIDEVRRLARAVRAEAAYLRSLSLELRKQRRAVLPKARIPTPVTGARDADQR